MKRVNVRLPTLLLGSILAAFFSAVTPYNNIKLYNTPLAGGHFALVAFASLLFLVLFINPLLSFIRRSWRLHIQEVLLVWCMVTISAGISYTALMRTFIINITTPGMLKSTATPQGETLVPLLPPSIFPTDQRVIQELYSGMEGGLDMSWWEIFQKIPWEVWVGPLVGWGIFILLVYMTMIGLAGIFSHQWIENEKMNFPLLRVVEVFGTESEQNTLWKFLTHKFFIVGLSIPVLLHLLNGLHTYFPHVPQIPTLILAQPYVPKEGLLSGFYKARIHLYPAFIGFAFVAPKQISFSLWFFFILGGLLPGVLQLFGLRLPAAALGTTFSPVLSSVEEMQMIGAFAVFFLFILWLARDHLKMVLRGAVLRKPLEGEFHGFMLPTTALYLFLAGFAGVITWLTVFGVDVITAVLFLIICFMIQVVTARLICQGGLPYFTLAVAPSDGFLAFFDTRIIGPASLYMSLIVQKVTFLDMRESLLPSFIHSSKLSEGSSPLKRFLGGLLLAIVLGLVFSFAAMLVLYYRYGLNTLPDSWAMETARRVHENAAQLISYPEGAKNWSMIFTFIGGAVMIFLVTGYHLFIWWPLHPIGYLTTYSSAMRILWFGFFIGWLCNTLVLRYGGVHNFREARRIFIGLIVGDMVMAIVWLVVGIFAPLSYHVLPM